MFSFTVFAPLVFVVSSPWTRTEAERMQHGPWQQSLSGHPWSPLLGLFAPVFLFLALSSVDGGLKSRQCHPVLAKPTITAPITLQE